MGDAIQTPSRGTSIHNHGGREYDPLRNTIDKYIQENSANGDDLIGLRDSFGNGGVLLGLVDWLAASFDESNSGGIDYIGGPEAGAGVLCGAFMMRLNPNPEARRKIGHIRIMKYADEKDVPEGFESRKYPTGRVVKKPDGSEEPEYKILAVHRGCIKQPPKKVILIDDWAETYRQLSTCADLLELQGADVVGAATIVSIQDGRADFEKAHPRTRPLLSLLDYERLGDRSLRRI